MGTISRQFAYNISSVIQVSTILTFINEVLDEAGITRTSDTGQLDVGSATMPGSNNTLIGYEIREFTDDISPVVLKMEWYRQNSTDRITVFITMGTGSDGTGNITDIFFPRTEIGNSNGFLQGISSWTNASLFSRGCGDSSAGNKAVMSGQWGGGGEWVFAIERWSDSAGEDTGGGVRMAWRCGNGVSFWSWVARFDGLIVPAETDGGCFPPSGQTTGQVDEDGYDSDTTLYPFFTFNFGVMMFPMRTIAGVFSSDISSESPFTGNNLGKSRKYFRCLAGSSTPRVSRGSTPSSTNFATAILWED